MAVRTTIYLDDELAARVRRLLPPRHVNRFINEAVAEKIAAQERQEIEQLMKEGYLATRDERDEIARDWQIVDGEGWPE